MVTPVSGDTLLRAPPTTFDIFWDLTGSQWTTDHARQAVAHAGVRSDSRVVAALAGDVVWTSDESTPASAKTEGASDALGGVFRDAAASGRGLAVIIGPWLPPFAALATVAEAAAVDPLIASAQPRFARADSGQVWALPVDHESAKMLERDDLAWLPDTLITPEMPSAAIVMTPAAVLAADPPPPVEARSGLALLLTAVRRLGFRNVVSNRVVVDYPLADPYVSASIPDVPDTAATDRQRARDWIAALPEARLERILAGAYRDGRPKLLLDCRHMPATHNGTTHAILGVLDGLAAAPRPGWDLELVASRESIEFHQLAVRYPGLSVATDVAKGTYLAAVHLTQPWRMNTFADLHDRAASMFFYFFDTIAWDIIYAAPDNLDAVWRFCGSWADGLIFDSRFTRARFERRFRMRRDMHATVAYLSLSPDDYRIAASDAASPPADGEIVVMGNSYDHKDVDRTARLLANALPDRRIVAFGGTDAGTAGAAGNITVVASGIVDDRSLDALLAGARLIVYPSYYEGFGLPVAFGLANGRTVITRASELWSEIADHTRMPGSLVTFADNDELVEMVRRALDGQPVPALPQGREVRPGARQPDWRACADEIMAAVESTVARQDGRLWLDRDTALSAREIAADKQAADLERALATLEADRERRSDLEGTLQDVLTQRDARTAERDALTAQLRTAAVEKDAAQTELEIMRGTVSWRITTPLRRIRRLLR